MDVKTGSGAFMATLEAAARELATKPRPTVAGDAGLPLPCSLITDMNEPLASAAGQRGRESRTP